jgi:hypothetical protein
MHVALEIVTAPVSSAPSIRTKKPPSVICKMSSSQSGLLCLQPWGLSASFMAAEACRSILGNSTGRMRTSGSKKPQGLQAPARQGVRLSEMPRGDSLRGSCGSAPDAGLPRRDHYRGGPPRCRKSAPPVSGSTGRLLARPSLWAARPRGRLLIQSRNCLERE